MKIFGSIFPFIYYTFSLISIKYVWYIVYPMYKKGTENKKQIPIDKSEEGEDNREREWLCIRAAWGLRASAWKVQNWESYTWEERKIVGSRIYWVGSKWEIQTNKTLIIHCWKSLREIIYSLTKTFKNYSSAFVDLYNNI